MSTLAQSGPDGGSAGTTEEEEEDPCARPGCDCFHARPPHPARYPLVFVLWVREAARHRPWSKQDNHMNPE